MTFALMPAGVGSNIFLAPVFDGYREPNILRHSPLRSTVPKANMMKAITEENQYGIL